MRISDWSSDVCSSDLVTHHGGEVARVELQMLGIGAVAVQHGGDEAVAAGLAGGALAGSGTHGRGPLVGGRGLGHEIGRASGRARVCQYVQTPVVAVSFKKTQQLAINQLRNRPT